MIYPSFISTAALTQETRSSLARTERALVQAQTELATGRVHDVGLALGAKTHVSVGLRQEQLQIETIRSSNALVATRLTATQAGLQNISDIAQRFLSTLVRGVSATVPAETIVAEAEAGLKSLLDAINTSFGGQYLFAGINSDVRPLNDYFGSPAPASRQAVTDDFTTAFGFPPGAAASGAIDQSAMQSFLDGSFADSFLDPGWMTNWSAASDRNIRSRISRSELVETSTNANAQPFRDLTAAFASVVGLGFEKLNEGSRQVILERAISLVGGAVGGVAGQQSMLGVIQERLQVSKDVLDLQQQHLKTAIDDLEGVDANEVATRLTTLLTQMESAYAITKRIHDLSLMNYL